MGIFQFALLVSLLLAGSNQNEVKVPTNQANALPLFEFEYGTTELTEQGAVTIIQVGNYLRDSLDPAQYRFVVYSEITDKELKQDAFLDYKRCKVVIDQLKKNGVESDIFLMRDSYVDNSLKASGVMYYVMTE